MFQPISLLSVLFKKQFIVQIIQQILFFIAIWNTRWLILWLLIFYTIAATAQELSVLNAYANTTTEQTITRLRLQLQAAEQEKHHKQANNLALQQQLADQKALLRALRAEWQQRTQAFEQQLQASESKQPLLLETEKK